VTLSAPNLDDRRFQDLVDDAKRLVQRNCPEWSDHNVSDPGVTLIEAVAFMVDQLVYRLNRVPERNYVKFLELLGLELYPAAAARTDVTFWLSAPQPDILPIPAGTEVATLRTASQQSTSFTTVEDLAIVPCEQVYAVTAGVAGDIVDRTAAASIGTDFPGFGAQPQADDAFYIGLSNPVPSCAVAIRLSCHTEGVGVDPTHPPLSWEAWDGHEWASCAVDRDGTAGLNQAGDVVIHLPRAHEVSVLPGVSLRAAWIRCRLIQVAEGQPTYSDPPQLTSISAWTTGGTAPAIHAKVTVNEIAGLSEEVPAQRFRLVNRPLVATDEPVVLEVASGSGWDEWTRVRSFASSGPDDHHFMLDEAEGDIVLGPAVREVDGALRQYGAVPPKGTPLRVRRYWSGGGRTGNVTTGAITQLKSSVPYVTRVENRGAAFGGVDGETLEDAKVRAPVVLRSRDRAVTTEDYELVAATAAPEIARVRCLAAGASDPGGVRVLLVPHVEDNERGAPIFDQLVPRRETLARIGQALDASRPIGSRVVIEPPSYIRVVVVAMVRARARAELGRVRDACIEALQTYLHPTRGGADGKGWPFGRSLHAAEVHGILLRVPEVEVVDEAKLFWTDPATEERSAEMPRIDLDEGALLHLFDHQIRVIEA